MNVRTAISQAIERIPNLLTSTVIERFTGKTERVTHSQEHVADLISAVLSGSLKADGYLIVKLPNIDTDDTGRRTIRVPVTAQPWVDGEVRIGPRGDEIAIVNVPARLPVQDVPALAAALLAAHLAHPC
ncbi:hypothetical protein [Mycobacteroides chelonae]|uniref:hypothetical protein n=1 Tax=Mycobacteroides chelonae TaxID=1774 RepID=UPI0018B06ADC|nr:hypothetical protein [Mycobacteroides chelonae]MBF9328498.1 hypothetical protein [Mycobacteroides chelonae]MBF9422676.1 hypothetical protein [Mycobacteroides chelonae]